MPHKRYLIYSRILKVIAALFGALFVIWGLTGLFDVWPHKEANGVGFVEVYVLVAGILYCVPNKSFSTTKRILCYLGLTLFNSLALLVCLLFSLLYYMSGSFLAVVFPLTILTIPSLASPASLLILLAGPVAGNTEPPTNRESKVTTYLPKNSFQAYALLLKLLAFLFGTLCFIWGFWIGVLGRSVECNPPGFGVRIIALFVLGLGLLYMIPNKRFSTKKQVIPYIVFTTFVSFSLFAYLTLGLFSNWHGNLSSLYQFLRWVLIVVPGTLAAPASLFFYLKAYQSDNSA